MVYITNVNMPKHCGECPFKHSCAPNDCLLHDGIPKHIIDLEKRPDWCPLRDSDETVQGLLSIIKEMSAHEERIFDELEEFLKGI